MHEQVFNKRKVITLICAIVIILVVLFIPKKVKVEVDDSLKISSNLYSSDINYEDIVEIKIIEDFEVGERVFGAGTFFNNIGDYKNSEGKYRLYMYSKIDKVIYIKTEDKVVVFNLDSNKATEDIYQEILSKK